QLLLAFFSPVLVSRDDWARGEYLEAQHRRVRSRGGSVNHYFAVKEFRLHVVPGHHACGYQQFLPRLRVFRQQHGENVVIIAAVRDRAIREDGDLQTAWDAKTTIEPTVGNSRSVA